MVDGGSRLIEFVRGKERPFIPYHASRLDASIAGDFVSPPKSTRPSNMLPVPMVVLRRHR